MQLGMIGLGRMGANMTRRLLRGGHACAVWTRSGSGVKELEAEGATGAASLADLVQRLKPPRVVWLMVPAEAVDRLLAELSPLLGRGDLVVDGGNTWWLDDQRRARELSARGLRLVDVGTSGGVWGLERGYCLMIGGEAEAVERLDPVFRALAPGAGREGFLHCGPSGAGHFVKMAHNGIEYGLMAAYAEGLNLLRHANAGAAYVYDLDVAAITELWRRGSVISSWLLDLTAAALRERPDLAGFEGRVADSGEGRWALQAAIETGTPAPVLAAALFQRFASRGEDLHAARALSAMRHAFGGHVEPRP